MAHVTEQWLILLINLLPIRAVHVHVVEILTLNAPRFPVDLCPLGTRIDLRFQLRDIQWTSADFSRSFCCDNAPTVCAIARLVQKFFPVRRDGIRTNAALEKRRGRTILQLVTLQTQCSRRSHNEWFCVEECSGSAAGEIAVVTRRNVHSEHSLRDPVEIDANNGLRIWIRLLLCGSSGGVWRFWFITRFG